MVVKVKKENIAYLYAHCHCGRTKATSCTPTRPDLAFLAYIHKPLRPPSYKSVPSPYHLKSPDFWEMK